MNIIKQIKDNTILIVPNNIKEKVLKEIDTLDRFVQVKVMSLEEIKKHLFFDYNEEALVYLKNKYNLKLSVCKTYLENMIYLPDYLTSSDKLNELTMIKNTLISHNLLKKDPFFASFLKNKKVMIYGYDYYTKFDLTVIEKLKKLTDTQVFFKVESTKKDLTVYEFNTITEEVEYIAKEIYQLLKQGVSINRIKLANHDSEYDKELKKVFSFYHIPIAIKEKIYLYDISIGKEVERLIKEGYDFYDIVPLLKEKFPLEAVNQMIQIFNCYPWFKEEKINILDFLIDKMKHTYLEEEIQEKKIEFIDLENNVIDDDIYVFLMGFNNGSIPKVLKDEEFISNKMREELGLSTTIEINKMNKDSWINICNSIFHLTITYKLKTAFDEFYPSVLIEDYHMKTEHKKGEVSYSREYNEIKLGQMLDDFIKYGKKNENLDLLYHNSSFKYYSYDHRFKGIDSDLLKEYLDHKLLLSYSTLDQFYHCKFRYFLSSVLKVSIYNETLATKIGTLFHYILSVSTNEDFDFETLYDTEVEKLINNGITKKEEFYLRKLKKELKEVLTVLDFQRSLTGFTKEEHEKKFYIDKTKDMKVTFMGIIDKILYQDKENQKKIAIVDYKTGDTTIDLTYLPHGLKMQLPIYLYLIKHSEEYQNSKICGLYLQRILNSITGSKKGLSEEYKDALKLKGYTTSNEMDLEVLDSSYEKSDMIYGMGKNKDGSFKSSSKIFTEEMLTKIDEMVDEKIETAITSILKGDFTINPKRLNGKEIGCEFCEFKDICFHKEEDFEELTEYKDLSFLGGEQNAEMDAGTTRSN